MEKIGEIFGKIERPKEKLAAYEWQDACAKVCKSLKIPNNKRSQMFKWFKTNRTKIEAVTRYVMENPKRDNFKYIAWMMSNV